MSISDLQEDVVGLSVHLEHTILALAVSEGPLLHLALFEVDKHM